jgi:hypothetical protein
VRQIFEEEEESKRRPGKLHGQKIYNFYTAPNIIGVVKSMKISWLGHIAHEGKR